MLRRGKHKRVGPMAFRLLAISVGLIMVAAACGAEEETPAEPPATTTAVATTEAPTATSPADPTLADANVLVVPYWLDQFNTANTSWISRLLAEAGVGNVDVINPDKSASKQLDIIETAIASGNYDAIAWQPIDETLAVATIQKIQDAGIAQVVSFSSLVPGTDGLNFAGATVAWKSTYFESGVQAAQFLLEHPDLGPPRIAYANIFPPEQKCDDLLTSLVEGVESVIPDDVVVVYNEGSTSQAEANSKMTDFIARGIQFNIYAGCGTTFDMGGFNAVRNAGLAGAVDNVPVQVYATSLDASPPELEVLWDPNLSMANSVMFGPKSAAEAVVELVLAQLTGEIGIDEAAEAEAALITLGTDCAAGQAAVLEQFEGVEGFEVPPCVTAAVPAETLADANVLVVPYWLDQFNTANTSWISRLLAEAGVGNVDVINPDKSASKQLDIIETAIASGNYDAIAWQPIDETLAVATIQKIQDAGIAQVVSFSSLVPGTDGLNFAGATVAWKSTYFESGVQAAQFLLEHPDLGPPRIAYANIFPPEQKCDDLLTSLVEGVESVIPDDVVVVYNEGSTSQAEANSKMTDFIARGIQFNIYAGCGTTFDMGGFNAVRNAGLAGAVDNVPVQVYATSLDASPPELEVLWDPNLSMANSVMFGPKSAAEAVVELVLAQLTGEIGIDEAAEAEAALITLGTDCAAGQAAVLEQFEGVEGFEVPACA